MEGGLNINVKKSLPGILNTVYWKNAVEPDEIK
jgi:hypothetical protein